MAEDTARAKTALRTLLADNMAKAIVAQRVRDFLESVYSRQYTKIITVTESPYTVSIDDAVLRVDASGGSVVINLPDSAETPPASMHEGRLLHVERMDATTANLVSIVRAGSDTIEGRTVEPVLSQYDFLTLRLTGTTWVKVSKAKLPQDMLLAQSEAGALFGKASLGEYPFYIKNVGASFVARETSRVWRGCAVSSNGRIQLACVNSGFLYTSTDFGDTWTQRDSSRGWAAVAMSADGKYQTAIVNAGTIYTSSDYGVTWTSRDSSRNWYRVAMSADGRVQAATVNGTGAGSVYISYDYGVTWIQSVVTAADYRGVAMSSDGRKITVVVYGGFIYTSDDYGITWTQRGTSKNWHVVAMSADGKFQTAGVYGVNLWRSSDYGVTWTDTAYGPYSWWDISMSADGRIQVVACTSFTPRVYASVDYGVTWSIVKTAASGVHRGAAISSDGKTICIAVDPGYIYESYATSEIKGEVDAIISSLVVAKEPTGFPNRTDSTISFTNSGRLFAIAPASTSFSYYMKGTKYTKSASESIAISNNDGVHYIWYDGATLTESTTMPAGFLTDLVAVAMVTWDATNTVSIAFADERHGMTMDGATHEYLHDTRGMTYEPSGLAIGNYTLRGDGSANSHAQCSISDGVVWDEDIEVSIKNAASPANPFEQILSTVAQIPTYYRSGASGVWRKNTTAVYPLKTGTNRIQWNQYSGGSWSQLDAATDGNFVAVWIFATNSIAEPVIAILGQREDTNLSDALRLNLPQSLSMGGLVLPEMKLLYRLIFRTSSAYTNTPKASLWDFVDYRNSLIRLADAIVNISIGALGTKTREFFSVARDYTTDLAGGYARYALVGAGTNKNFTLMVPMDFVSLVSIDVIFSSASNNTGNITVATQYGAMGEDVINTHNGTTGAVAYTVDAAEKLYAANFNSAVASLGAQDLIGINVAAATIALHIYGIRLRYNIE